MLRGQGPLRRHPHALTFHLDKRSCAGETRGRRLKTPTGCYPLAAATNDPAPLRPALAAVAALARGAGSWR